jgi:hypothetical protein
MSVGSRQPLTGAEEVFREKRRFTNVERAGDTAKAKKAGRYIMTRRSFRLLSIANTEFRYFGTQLLAFYLKRHGFGASYHSGNENLLNRIRNYPHGIRVFVHGAGSEIHALGITSAEPATEVLRTAILEVPWDESLPAGATIPLRIVYRTLDHFHRFERPINLASLGWSPDWKPIMGTINELPDEELTEDIWKKAVNLAIQENEASLLK